MRRIAESILVTAASVAVVVLMLAPLGNYAHFLSATTPGDPKLLAWTFAWTSHAILSGTPLLDANVFYPASPALAFAEHHVGVGIWGLPLFALTGNATLVYGVLEILALVLNAVTMYAFVRRWLPGRGPAVIAALVFSVSTPRLLYGSRVPIVWNCWLPLLLITLHRWGESRRWRWLWASAALFVLQALATWYLAVMALVVVVIFVGWRQVWAARWGDPASEGAAIPARHGRHRWILPVFQAVAGTALVALVIWPFARPYAALGGQERVSAELAARYSADLGSYVQPHEHALMGPLIGRVTGLATRRIGSERAQFLGLVTIALALLGAARVLALALRRRQGGGRPEDLLWGGCFLLVGVVAAGMSFGPGGAGSFGLFDLILNAPALNLFRVPSRFAVLVVFGAAGLAALGFAQLQRLARRASLVALPLLVPAMLLEWAVVPPDRMRPQPEVVPPIYQVVAGLHVNALVSLPCYRLEPTWPLDADYMLYSTTHWLRIVNGYGRAEPAAWRWVAGSVKAFPGSNSAIRMRRLGIDTVVLHSGRYEDGAAAILREALASPDFALVARVGGDYLFRVLPAR